MKRLILTLSTMVAGLALLMMPLDAYAQREHSRNGGRGGHSTSQPSRQHNNSRPSSPRKDHGSFTRPSGNNHNQGMRPGNQGGRPASVNGNHQRPNGGNQNFRPGNNNNGSNNGRPGMGNQRPGNNNRPGPGHNVAPRPGHTHNYGHGGRPAFVRPPMRPHRPIIARPHYRPVPPPAWRPHRGLPVIRGILGLTFGVAFNASLDYLFNNGYTVDGYENDIVYLRNVQALNYIWPDAALYYGVNGLDASTFYYTTPVYNISRYNQCYASLVNVYGMPISTNNVGGSISATWFGGGGNYVTLNFGNSNGRFVTSLTYGM